MATLTGNSVGSTYKQLLKVTSEGIGADASAKYIEDGLGTDSALSLSTTRVGIGTASPVTSMHITGADGGGSGTFNGQLTLEDTAAYNATPVTGINFKTKYNAAGAVVPLAGITGAKENATDGNYAGYLALHTREAGYAAAERMRITSTGNVGIGTASPLAPFHLHASASDFDPESHVIISSSSVADGDLMGVMFKQRDENDGKAWFGTERMGDYGVSDFVFLLDNAGDDNAVAATDEVMRITRTGSVGIGTAAPPSPLTIETTSAASYPLLVRGDIDNDGGYTGISFGLNGNDSYQKARIHVEGTSNYVRPDMHFLLDATDDSSNATLADAKLSILNNGNVGIGTAAPNHPVDIVSTINTPLEIEHSDGTDVYMRFSNTGGAAYIAAQSNDLAFYTSASATERMRLDANSRISLSNNDAGGTGGDSSTTGNTILGHGIGDTVTNAINNTFLGHKVAGGGTKTTATRSNVGVGNLTMYALTSGANNTAVGKDALTAVNTGANNVAIGQGSGDSITSGAKNVLIGSYVADSLSEGTSNIAIGYSAIGAVTAHTQGLIAIGEGAIEGSGSTTTGANYSIAIGNLALTALTSGAGNTAVGYTALSGNTTGARNTAIGYGAMNGSGGATVLDSDDNVFLGYDSGGGTWATGKTEFNVGVGNYTLDGGLNGCSSNTAVGYGSMTASMTEASFNSAFGRDSLSAVSTGAYNVGVGRMAGDVITSGGSNTIVGANSDPSANNASNQTVIGSSITGNQDNGTVIGGAGIFQFASKEYTCDHADAEDGKSAASEASPLKLPAYSIIKSISVIVKTLSNLSTYNVALYHSTDTAAPADDTALGGTPVEVLGAGASDTCSGNSASAVDIALGSGTVLKQSYYNAYGGAGLPVGTADRYIHVGQAGTGNGDTDPSTAGVIKVLVEYVGLD